MIVAPAGLPTFQYHIALVQEFTTLAAAAACLEAETPLDIPFAKTVRATQNVVAVFCPWAET